MSDEQKEPLVDATVPGNKEELDLDRQVEYLAAKVKRLERDVGNLAQAVEIQNNGMRDFALRISKLEQANVAYGPILNEAAKLVPIGSAMPQGRGCGGCKK